MRPPLASITAMMAAALTSSARAGVPKRAWSADSPRGSVPSADDS